MQNIINIRIKSCRIYVNIYSICEIYSICRIYVNIYSITCVHLLRTSSIKGLQIYIQHWNILYYKTIKLVTTGPVTGDDTSFDPHV